MNLSAKLLFATLPLIALAACGDSASDPDAHSIPEANGKAALSEGAQHSGSSDGLIDYFRIEVPVGDGQLHATLVYSRSDVESNELMMLSLAAEEVQYPEYGLTLASAGDVWSDTVDLVTALPDSAGGRYYLVVALTALGDFTTDKHDVPYTLSWTSTP